MLMGMAIAGLLPAIAKLVRQTVDERRLGRTLGTLQSAQFSGQVLGPLAGGAIGAHLGLAQVFWLTGTLLLACAALGLRARNRYAADLPVPPLPQKAP
jgi:DHA1 family multidrug resistance protein-like MFS transporter